MFASGFSSLKGNYSSRVKELYSRFKKNISLEQREDYDYTPSLYKKRYETAINGIDNVKKHLAGICDDSVIEAYFATSNMLIMRGGYNYAIDYCNITALSAAIWILDQLTLEGKLKECYQYLPVVSLEECPEELMVPVIKHPTYDYRLILSVVKLIRQRNSAKISAEKSIGSILWDKKPEKDAESAKNREAFDSVMGLIDQKAIDRAVGNYENDIWKFYKISFLTLKIAEDRIEKLEKERDAINSRNQSSQPNILLMNSPDYLTAFSKAVGPDWQSRSLGQTDKRIQAIEAEIDRLFNITFTQLSLVNDREKTVRKLKGVIPESLGTELVQFRVADPFESSFALLYLLDSGSSLPWYYYGSISVAYTMCDQIPYDVPFDGNIADCDHPVLVSGLNELLFEHKFKGYRWADQTDVSGETVQREYAKNLSQLLFMFSGSLLPRVIPQESVLNGLFDEIGSLTEREKEIFSLLVYTLNSGHLRDDGYTWYKIEKALKSHWIDAQHKEENHFSDKYDALTEENRRLNEKNAYLIALLQESLQQSRNDQKALETTANEYERQRKELADLREKVFLLTHNDINDEPEDKGIVYPYHSTARILSFGGHMSWINEMKKKLPNVVFVSPDVLPNTDLIRGADEVWIQTNCIAHKDYYRIMETLKRTGKQIRYYVYNGVNKCAEQLVKSCENNKR